MIIKFTGEQRGALAYRQVGEVLDEAAHGLFASQHGVGVLAAIAGDGRLGVECFIAPARAANAAPSPAAMRWLVLH